MSVVKIADYQDKERWDDFVLSQEDAGPYHLFAWKEAVQNAYRHKAFYLIHENGDKTIQGVLPLFHVKPPLLKGMLVSQPFCDYGGSLTRNLESFITLVNYAQDLSQHMNATLEIRFKSRAPDLEASLRIFPTSNKVRMVLELPGSSETLWNGFKSKLRTKIKKPQKDGLTFKMGAKELVGDFYSIFRNNMRHLGSPVHSKKWINSVMNCFEKDAHIGVVYFGNTPVAAGIILCCKEIVTNPWASTLREYNKFHSNNLLYWGFLEYACDNGFKYFDFGRSTPGEGTYVFKEQWGAQPFPLYWYSVGNKFAEQPIVSTGKIRHLVEDVWSRIPPAVTDSIGPIIRRYITL